MLIDLSAATNKQ